MGELEREPSALTKKPAASAGRLWRRLLGRWGEELAAVYLKQQGYELRERNYRTRYGEIDLIAREGGTLVFVEVKTRRSFAFGVPEEALTSGKRRCFSHAAREYCRQRRLAGMPVRFDVVAISLGRGAWLQKIELIKDAFHPEDNFWF